MKPFFVSMYHGFCGRERILCNIAAKSAERAARHVLSTLDKDATIYSIRVEPPEERNRKLFTVLSFGTSASGLRMYVYEQIGYEGGLARRSDFESTQPGTA